MISVQPYIIRIFSDKCVISFFIAPTRSPLGGGIGQDSADTMLILIMLTGNMEPKE